MKLAFIGGDKRCEYAAKYLEQVGYEPFYISNIYETYKLKECAALILGVAATDEYGKIKGCNFDLTYADAVKLLPENAVVIGGRLPLYTGKCGVDVLGREDFSVLNAAITAENAVMLAASCTDFSIYASNVLICGFGRIGKMLAHRLMPFGCDITCSVRKSEHAALCNSYGIKTVKTSEIENTADRYDIIFNTIPAAIIDEKTVSKLKKEAVIIELASKPGGLSEGAMAACDVKIVDGGSLPGRFSPATAGKIYGITIENILKEGVEYGT